MEHVTELKRQIDAELEALGSTLDDYEQTLAEIDGTLSENTLDETESVRRRTAADGKHAGAD
ncbi:hypothetical protein [Halovenus sp. HT40]|uniref:hypothetical protein n=1 Tax=Halovenus sp. HT40 TaxID=3126691 RepID=UPI00300F17B6